MPRCFIGYLYYELDWGEGGPAESLPILAAWEPIGDAQAFRACFLDSYISMHLQHLRITRMLAPLSLCRALHRLAPCREASRDVNWSIGLVPNS
jgi:hypothetical protein